MTLKDYCKRWNLTCISHMYQAGYKTAYTTYVHWQTDGKRFCESGSGETQAEALANAIAVMKEKRQ